MNEHVALRVPARPDDYDVDFSAWALRQAALIRDRRFDLLDADNICEEIESLSRRERHSVEKRLRTLIEHLLKLRFFTLSEEPKRGWRVTIIKTRLNLASTFNDNPSLFAQRDVLFANEWAAAGRIAKVGLSDDPVAMMQIDMFPLPTLFDVDQALDLEFFPDA